ncbi:hypothetical protein DEIPH_ctg139orf0140 [Deinococcus phoenicis]|uniref:Uncharacterized protein n=1 Tax=Deinococcus phoenicis TaxID=1476583 RepID=A0A016QKJ5_9DEIO|nr:hypothetical protein [Deinococcus phoenicis]EYB66412.1 hypothetical protein DEIPH_ctg139orf0140 [Deinococcus phoenicis]
MSAAALQLLPENADVWHRLEVLATAAASRVQPGRRPKGRDLRRLLRQPALRLGDVALNEDPHEHLFTQAFPSPEGPLTVFPGPVTGGIQPLGQLHAALRFDNGRLPTMFAERAARFIDGVVRLSDELARRAHLPRSVIPPAQESHEEFPERDVTLPSPERLTDLRRAVVFTPADFMACVGPEESEWLLTALAVDRGTLDLSHFEREACGPLPLRPLVRFGRDIVVAAPHALLAAATRALLRLAQDMKVTDVLNACVADGVHGQTLVALARLGLNPAERDLGPPPWPCAVYQGLYTYDVHRRLYVIEVIEPAENVRPDSLVSRWVCDLEGLRAYLDDLGEPDAPALVVSATHGDAVRLHTSDKDAMRLIMLGPHDLEVVSRAYREQPLTLHRFAEARRALHERFLVSRPRPIDEFVFLAGLDFRTSFGLPGVENIALLTFDANEFVRSTEARSDAHYAPWLCGRRTLLVERSPVAREGLYVPLAPPWTHPVVYLDHRGARAWVLDGNGRELRERDDSPPRPVTPEALVVTCALWLLDILEARSDLRPAEPVVAFAVFLNEDLTDAALTLVSEDKTTVGVALGGPFNNVLAVPDNTGERILVAEVFRAWAVLCRGEFPREDEVRDVVDVVAPRGDKRYLMNPTSFSDPTLDPRNVPPLALVHPANEHAFHILAGTALREGFQLEPGPIALPDTRLLNAAVQVLYGELQVRLRDYNPRALLDTLVNHHDGMRFRTALRSHMAVARAIAFGGDSPEEQEVLRRLPTSATAARFLIEYVAARPPTGTRVAGLLELEELLSLASTIIHYASTSDVVEYGVGSAEAHLSVDGALRARSEEFLAATERQLAFMLDRMAKDALRERYAEYAHEDAPEPDASHAGVTRLVQEACQDVYGLPLTRLLSFMRAVLDLGEPAQGRPVRMTQEAFEARMGACGWELGEVRIALRALTLEPRPNYLKPPSPWKPSEVYPWQFNREFSMLRRPIVRQPDNSGSTELVWGNRTLQSSLNHWLHERFLGGRFAPEAFPVANAHMQNLRHLYACEFNDEVAVRAERCGWTAHKNLKRFGDLRLEEDGKPLGDVDVLVVDHERAVLLAAECKDWVLARTPAEVRSRIEELFLGDLRADGTRERSILEKHERRLAWLRRNLAHVRTVLDLQDGRSWAVEGCIVTSRPPSDIFARRATIPLLSLDDFEAVLRRTD